MIIFIYLYLFFFDQPTGQTRGWIFTRDSSKDVKSRKGLNNIPPNLRGSKIPIKLNFGGVNRTFKPEQQKIQTLITCTHNECAFVGGPLTPPPNKSKMAVAAILNIGKMPITLEQIKISAPHFMERCIATMRI